MYWDHPTVVVVTPSFYRKAENVNMKVAKTPSKMIVDSVYCERCTILSLPYLDLRVDQVCHNTCYLLPCPIEHFKSRSKTLRRLYRKPMAFKERSRDVAFLNMTESRTKYLKTKKQECDIKQLCLGEREGINYVAAGYA